MIGEATCKVGRIEDMPGMQPLKMNRECFILKIQRWELEGNCLKQGCNIGK